MEIIEILSVLPVAEIDLSLVKRAIETHKIYGISYWDSPIVAAAERTGCPSSYQKISTTVRCIMG
jgi:predicted nucleic acid-binding protein